MSGTSSEVDSATLFATAEAVRPLYQEYVDATAAGQAAWETVVRELSGWQPNEVIGDFTSERRPTLTLKWALQGNDEMYGSPTSVLDVRYIEVQAVLPDTPQPKGLVKRVRRLARHSNPDLNALAEITNVVLGLSDRVDIDTLPNSDTPSHLDRNGDYGPYGNMARVRVSEWLGQLSLIDTLSEDRGMATLVEYCRKNRWTERSVEETATSLRETLQLSPFRHLIDAATWLSGPRITLQATEHTVTVKH